MTYYYTQEHKPYDLFHSKTHRWQRPWSVVRGPAAARALAQPAALCCMLLGDSHSVDCPDPAVII